MLAAALLLCVSCALAARSRLADHGPAAPQPPPFVPATDVPYEELVPQRFVLASAAPIYNWGQLPFDDVAQVASGQLDGNLGAFVLSSSSLLFVQYNTNFTQTSVALDGISLDAGSRIATDPVSYALVAIATPDAFYFVSCSEALCSIVDVAGADFGAVTDMTVVPGSSLTAYIASPAGGYMYEFGSGLQLLQAEPPTAVAYYPAGSMLAFGGSLNVYLYVNNTMVRRDWVTNVTTGTGGVYDGPVTSMAFDKYGWLFVGTTAAVNILFPNQTVNHLSRFQGLPYNETTSVSIEYNTQYLWVGTTKGAARWNRTDGSWRYFYLQRYLPGLSIVTSLSSGIANFTVLATDGGISIIESQYWTLAQKAAYMEVVQARHNRHGLSAACNLQAYGNFSSCTNGPDDNNGLWTSLVVGAECFRYAVTGDPAAEAEAINYLLGMQSLNGVTGIKGLMGRSNVMPGEPGAGSAADGWVNSTAAGYEGWAWESTASSDEVVGHFFAYSIFAKTMNQTSPYTEIAVSLLHNIAQYIVENDFYLIDYNGQPTEWGKWNPAYLDLDFDWADER